MQVLTRQVTPDSAHRFIISIMGVSPDAHDATDEVRDQLSYAFTAEDARRFQLEAIHNRHGRLYAIANVSATHPDLAEYSLNQLLLEAFVSPASGGQICISVPVARASFAIGEQVFVRTYGVPDIWRPATFCRYQPATLTSRELFYFRESGCILPVTFETLQDRVRTAALHAAEQGEANATSPVDRAGELGDIFKARREIWAFPRLEQAQTELDERAKAIGQSFLEDGWKYEILIGCWTQGDLCIWHSAGCPAIQRQLNLESPFSNFLIKAPSAVPISVSDLTDIPVQGTIDAVRYAVQLVKQAD